MKFFNIKRVVGIVLAISFMFVVPVNAGTKVKEFEDGYEMTSLLATYLADKGLIDGYPDNTFKPEKIVNRAEAAKMLVKILEIQPDFNSASSFTDVGQKHWAKPYIQALVAHGYLSGYPDGRFGVNDRLTLEQVAILMSRITGTENSVAELKKENKDWYYLFLSTLEIEPIVNTQVEEDVKRGFFAERMLLAKLYKQYGLVLTYSENHLIPNKPTTYHGDGLGGFYYNVNSVQDSHYNQIFKMLGDFQMKHWQSLE